MLTGSENDPGGCKVSGQFPVYAYGRCLVAKDGGIGGGEACRGAEENCPVEPHPGRASSTVRS